MKMGLTDPNGSGAKATAANRISEEIRFELQSLPAEPCSGVANDTTGSPDDQRTDLSTWALVAVTSGSLTVALISLR